MTVESWWTCIVCKKPVAVSGTPGPALLDLIRDHRRTCPDATCVLKKKKT